MRIGVIGGGIIGCSVAWELTRRGIDVHLFEGRGIAAGATQASAGALVPFVEAHDPGPLRQLTARSLEMYDEFVAAVEQDSGGSVDYARCGSVEVARTTEEAERLKRMAERESDRGITWLDESELLALIPVFGEDVMGGVSATFHAYVRAAELTRALATAITRRGGPVHTRAVERVRAAKDAAIVQDASGTTHYFDRIVLAAGSWGSRIHVEGFGQPPVRPVKGQLLRVRIHGGRIDRILWSSDCYVVPQAGGEILIGATVEEVGFDEEPTGQAAEALLGAFRRLVPRLEPSVVSHLVGLRPSTPDDLPIIGSAADTASVVYSVGHFRNGVVLAPLTARLVADLVEGRAHDTASDLVSPSRFGL